MDGSVGPAKRACRLDVSLAVETAEHDGQGNISQGAGSPLRSSLYDAGPLDSDRFSKNEAKSNPSQRESGRGKCIFDPTSLLTPIANHV
jgi:hypothetical protein